MDERRREILNYIGERVKHHRRDLGLSRDEVAKLLGISQQWVQKTEAKALRKLKVKESSKNLKEFL